MSQTPIEPVPDTIAGPWLPGYRGYNVHGGPDVGDYEPMESGYDTDPGLTEYEKPSPNVDPIAVKIVSDPKPQSRKDWRVSNVAVSASPQLIVGLNEKRLSCKIRNNDAANPVYVSPDSSPSPFLSWRLAPGGELSLNAVTDVWAIADAGNMVSVSILTEYEIEI